MLSSFVSIACLALLASAQSNPTLDLQGIQAQFQAAHIVPDLLQSFNPTAVLAFSYNGQVVAAGTPETVDAVKTQPSLTVTVPAGTTLGKTFTLAMVDPGAAGSDSSAGQTRHWLVNGVTVGDNGALNFPAETTITSYGGPLPPDGSGAHRYVFLLYDQPTTFTPPADLASPGQPITLFNVNDYAKSSGLGAVVAGSYYSVEIGTATGSVVPTTAVNTSTLPAAQSGGAGSGTGTGTGTSTSTSTTKPKPTNAAVHQAVNVGLAGFAVLVGVLIA
jgi:phosphatidylethanolamine-binding protein (PEBP) family uncharacterized protein